MSRVITFCFLILTTLFIGCVYYPDDYYTNCYRPDCELCNPELAQQGYVIVVTDEPIGDGYYDYRNKEGARKVIKRDAPRSGTTRIYNNSNTRVADSPTRSAVYSYPRNVGDLEQIAKSVARQAKFSRNFRLIVDPNLRSSCNIGSVGGEVLIRLRPPLDDRSLNTWAFIFGHEFYQITYGPAKYGPNPKPQDESEADIEGARYAIAAGYNVAEYIGWMTTLVGYSSSHGSWQNRANALVRAFNVRPNEYQHW
ncbi:MAG: hypothetical protein AB3N14_01580 [Flavobacteriaceae bacterium]